MPRYLDTAEQKDAALQEIADEKDRIIAALRAELESAIKYEFITLEGMPASRAAAKSKAEVGEFVERIIEQARSGK